MGDSTKIEWTDHTFNPWWGCSRVSPACRFCYADSQAQRYGHQVWRRNGERRMLSDNNWRQPLRWNRQAERNGKPEKVFCASMADVFEDHPQLDEPRKRLWGLIEETPWLQWQLLTKRPENVAGMAPWGDSWPANVWLGCSVETQRFAEQRIPILLRIPAATKFLSCEPLLEEIDLRKIRMGSWVVDSLGGDVIDPRDGSVLYGTPSVIDWVILGAESGPKSRETDMEWIRSVLRQCERAWAAPFVKQLGTAWARDVFVGGKSVFAQGDRKGGDWSFWPADLKIRQFPETREVASR